MRKLSVCMLGFGGIAALLGAYWRFSAEPVKVRSSALEERHEPAAGATPPRFDRIARRPPAEVTNVAATTAEDPTAAHSLIDAMGENEPIVDFGWDERLSLKPDKVVDFFHQKSATFAEWARAYRADICACSSFECVTALQDDFASRAPPFTDMRQDEETSAEIRAAITCANRHLPTPPRAPARD
jgi:hypothetical protein